MNISVINKLETEKPIDKLNKVFVDGNVLSAGELNQVTSKVDEIVDVVNNTTPSTGGGR